MSDFFDKGLLRIIDFERFLFDQVISHVGLLLGVILILYLLQYFPALALGPFVEHLLLQAGKAF